MGSGRGVLVALGAALAAASLGLAVLGAGLVAGPEDAGAAAVPWPPQPSDVPAPVLLSLAGTPVPPVPQATPGALVPAGWVVQVDTGRAGSPVMGNLTVTGAQANGFASVRGCGRPGTPTTSSINFRAGQTLANAAAVTPDAQGKFCIYSSATTHIVWDHTATIDASLLPDAARIIDTRATVHTEYEDAGAGATPAMVSGGRTLVIPTGAPGAVLMGNLTSTGAAANGYVALHPCDAGRPATSALNYARGATVASFAMVRADAAGNVCAYTTATTHLIWDQAGAVAATPVAERVIDTRTDPWTSQAGAAHLAGEAVPAGTAVRIARTHGTLVGTLTATGPARNGYATVFPCDQGLPTASNLNYPAGQTVANLVAVAADGSDDICVHTSADTHLIWDETGRFAADPGRAPTAPERLLDTRLSWQAEGPHAATSTVVGVGQRFPGAPRPLDFGGDEGPAEAAIINRPTTVAADGRGGYYFTDSMNGRIRHVDAAGVVRTVVGSGSQSPNQSCAYDVPALQACLAVPHGVTLDTDGSLIIADTFNNVITRLGPDGILRRIAGSGRYCDRAKSTCGEGGPWSDADLRWPTIARQTPAGLVISDSAHRILLVRDGVIVRIAGTGVPGFDGDNGAATAAQLWAPADVIPYRGGWLVSDGNNCRLRWVDPEGVIRPFAGYGGDLTTCWNSYAKVPPGQWGDADSGDVGDGRAAVAARMSVTGLLTLNGGDVYVTDFLNNRVRRIDSEGTITTVVGTGGSAVTNTDGPVPGPVFALGWVSGVDYDAVRNRLLITDSGSQRILQARLA